MAGYVYAIRCKECIYHGECAISRGEDWYCADGKPITNTVNDNSEFHIGMEYLNKMLNTPIEKELTMMEYIPKNCRHCSNHPSNGGSGICHCILGSETIT